MIDRTKKLPARFYLNAAGRNPVREWILELPAADRHTVGTDIQKVSGKKTLFALRRSITSGGYRIMIKYFLSGRMSRY
jgi:hypothetical protein